MVERFILSAIFIYLFINKAVLGAYNICTCGFNKNYFYDFCDFYGNFQKGIDNADILLYN